MSFCQIDKWRQIIPFFLLKESMAPGRIRHVEGTKETFDFQSLGRKTGIKKKKKRKTTTAGFRVQGSLVGPTSTSLPQTLQPPSPPASCQSWAVGWCSQSLVDSLRPLACESLTPKPPVSRHPEEHEALIDQQGRSLENLIQVLTSKEPVSLRPPQLGAAEHQNY